MINATLGSRLSWVGGGAKLVDRHLKFQHWSTPHVGGGYTGVCVMDILSSVHKHFRNILETINCTLYFKKKFSPLSSELPQYIRSNSGPSNQSILYCKRQKKIFFYLLEVLPCLWWHVFFPVHFLCDSLRGCDWEGAACLFGAREEQILPELWSICTAAKQHPRYPTKRPRGTTALPITTPFFF